MDGLIICQYDFCLNYLVYSWLIQFKILLLCRIWCEMTEDHKRMLAVFDVRVRDLMEFCDRLKEKINELESSLAQKEGELQQAMKTIEELNA